jgi:hypothetical protein
MAFALAAWSAAENWVTADTGHLVLGMGQTHIAGIQPGNSPIA